MPSQPRAASAAVKSSSHPDSQASTDGVNSAGGELLGEE